MAENDIKTEEVESQEPQSPVCLCCMQPVDPMVHYCPNCGEATGRFTTYLPFESIPWKTHIWGRMWRQIWSRDVSIAGRLLRLFMIVWTAPVLLIGLLFRRRNGARDSTEESPEPPQNAS